MNTFVAVCGAGFMVLLYLAAKDVQGQLYTMRNNLAKLEELINKNAGRTHAVEGKADRLQSTVDLLAEDVAIIDYHRELLGDERRTYVSPN